MTEAARERPPRLWVLRICVFATVAGVAQVIVCVRPVSVARRFMRSYRAIVGGLPWVRTEMQQICDVLDFHLLSQADPVEALGVVEGKLKANPDASFICADYAIAGQLADGLSLREKAISYYQRAAETAPPTSNVFRAGMAERVQRLSPIG